jgi:hypothetical protein
MLNFHYAAYSYLDWYLLVDKPCIEALAPGTTDEIACHGLSKMAMSYSISRNLAINQTEALRFATALSFLRNFKGPKTNEEVANLVCDFSITLGRVYPRQSGTTPVLLSAASKFLWMRFKSPVVMYDRYAWQWVKRTGKLAAAGSYSDYLRVWRENYDSSKKLISEACLEIVPFKKFTLAESMSDEELKGIVRQAWFQERVFDHSIVDAEQKRNEERAAMGTD